MSRPALPGQERLKNNGSENIAVFGFDGNLDFYWEDGATYQREMLAASGGS